jgi:putative ABC transport system permease protein
MRSSGVFRFLWQEARGSRLQLLGFALSIVIGVAAVVGASSVNQIITRALGAEAKKLLGADLVITAREPLSERITEAAAHDRIRSTVEIRFRSMAGFESAAPTLVQVRGIEGEFPLYGTLKTEPVGANAAFQQGVRGVLIDTALNDRLNVAPGALVRLGTAQFPILGVVRSGFSDGGPGGFFAPAVYIQQSFIAETGLLTFGSVAEYKLALAGGGMELAKVRETIDPFVASGELQLTTVADRERLLGESLRNGTSFFALVGVVTLVLGAIGAVTTLRLFLLAKARTVGLLKCIGARTSWITQWLLIEVGIVGVVGALIGALAGQWGAGSIVALLPRAAGISIEASFSPLMTIFGVGIGTLLLLILCLPSIELLRRVSPLSILRPTGELRPRRILSAVVWSAFAAIIAALSFSFVGNVRVASLFLVASFLTIVLLFASARILQLLVGRSVHPGLPLPLRFGFRFLSRARAESTTLILACGVTALALQSVAVVEELLTATTVVARGAERPNLFVFDIQQDQRQGVEALLRGAGGVVHQQVPVVLMRISSINGRSVRDLLADKDSTVPSWTLQREYWSSYRSTLAENEEVVAGTWIPAVEPSRTVIPISIEDRLAERFGITLGASIIWEIQGVAINTEIASIRKIQWERLQRNSFVVFPEGVLTDAPQTFFFAASLKDAEQKVATQRAMAEQFPNVSFLDLEQIIRTVEGLFDQLLYSLRLVSALVGLAAGVVLLVGMASALRLRRHELALFQIFGLSRRRRWGVLLTEQLGLALIGFAVGTAMALLVGWVVAVHLLGVPFTVGWLTVLGRGGLVLVLVGVLTGYLAFRRQQRSGSLLALEGVGQ